MIDFIAALRYYYYCTAYRVNSVETTYMDLSSHISPDQILTGITPPDKWALIDIMSAALKKHPICLRQDDTVFDAITPTIITREKTMSTAIGHGIAFPHGRVRGFRDFVVCIASLARPIEYETPDNVPISLAVMVVTSENNPTIALQVISVLSRLCADPATRAFFTETEDSKDIYSYLQKKKLNLDVSITARDIMRIPLTHVTPDMPLREITYIMMKNRLEALPVTDNDAHVVGEITCDILFQKGIPDFFTQLKSVSFIRDFDPFEKYFAEEAQAVAADVMNTSCACVEEDATLMEIVFLLSVKNHPKVYVTRKTQLAGIIDRSDVLDRILNL